VKNLNSKFSNCIQAICVTETQNFAHSGDMSAPECYVDGDDLVNDVDN